MSVSLLFNIAMTCMFILVAIVLFVIVVYHSEIKKLPDYAKRDMLKEQIGAANRTLLDLEEQKKNMEAEIVQANSLIAQGEFQRKWMTDNADTYEEMKRQITQAKLDLSQVADDTKNAETKLDEVKEQLEEIDKRLLEKTNEKNAVELERNRLKVESSDLMSTIVRQRQDTKLLADRLEDLHKDINELEHKKADLENQCKQLERQDQNLTKHIAERQAELETMHTQHDDLTKKVTSLETEFAGFAGKQEAESKVWEDLDRPYITDDYKKKEERAFQQEELWLEEFMQRLGDSHIIFNERTIKAFHTSLKVADSSPLTVLAGISGTGKSLLPMLYAKAAGMNFIQIAVQPRWDSPQDLLGFYNYMQKKFKATELSRLLWQFDVYNNKGCSFKGKEQTLPMNIVLLDEMNLARIEYYFSDLLSKLEVRRAVDDDFGKSMEENEKSFNRRAAEIEIECGALKDSMNSRHLFIGRNTLFIGTMNEDETTQILSDKVIDRSNVLRFGKPDKLTGDADISGFEKKYHENTYLSLAAWKQWQSNTMGAIPERIGTEMEQINNELNKVGRPFGHRVWQAITKYIIAYPAENSSAKYQYALADQIEMKILPKLNGLEKDEGNVRDVLDNVARIVENATKDNDLIQAFETAKKDTSTAFFQWKGVIR
ncbi:MAG: AAA family ATPase [Spirochaetia bacterium]|jgi:predicted  nucleic acid-binding Zn-ribbon protein|nr:AAA family ATPase [Spirochaetia bacterium]